MDELTKAWSCLNLSECEGSNFCIKEEQAATEFVVAAKFLTKRALNLDAIAKTLTPLWRSKNGFKIKKECDHVVLFTFDSKSEMEKVLAAEPWSFDKHLMVLQRYETETVVGEMKFNKVTFWVQVHDLPVRFWTRRIAEQLCKAIGTVNVMTDEAETEGENFMRVRVTIDISQPLCRGRVISLDSGKELWVSFKYERLPNLCYWCGRLTHDDRDCDLWVESEGSLSTEAQQFGPWVKAAPFTPTRRFMIKVPGFFAGKKSGVSSTSSRPAKKPPVMLVRTGKPSPVIIRPEKENFEAPSSENIIPDFQEVNPLNSWPPIDEGIMEEVTLIQTGSVEKKLYAENFEEIMEGIDKEIKKFDSTTSEKPGCGAKTGKEICVDPLCINEVTLNQNGSEEKKQPAENFEETIEGMDKEIKKLDSTTPGKPGFKAKTGKENFVESLCINESCEPNLKAHGRGLLEVRWDQMW